MAVECFCGLFGLVALPFPGLFVRPRGTGLPDSEVTIYSRQWRGGRGGEGL